MFKQIRAFSGGKADEVFFNADKSVGFGVMKVIHFCVVDF